MQNKLNGIPIDYATLKKRKTDFLRKVLQALFRKITDMVTEQLIVALVFQNIMKTRHREEENAARPKMRIGVVQHPFRVLLVLEEVKLHHGIDFLSDFLFLFSVRRKGSKSL